MAETKKGSYKTLCSILHNKKSIDEGAIITSDDGFTAKDIDMLTKAGAIRIATSEDIKKASRSEE